MLYAADSIIIPLVRIHIRNLSFERRKLTTSANFSHASTILVSSIFTISSYISVSILLSSSVKGLPLEGFAGGASDLDNSRDLRTWVDDAGVGCTAESLDAYLVPAAGGGSETGLEAAGDPVKSGRA